MGDEELVLVFHEDQVLPLVRDVKHSFSFYGGPLELDVSGVSFGPRPLHLIANLSHHHIPPLGPPRYVWEVPLAYGMRYSGCAMRYRFEPGKLQVLEIEPSDSDEDWPYVGYPKNLPYVPLKPGISRKASWQEFAETIPNLPEEQPAELVAIVEPPMTLGVSLWGKSGDAEGVVIVFECNLDAREVSVYNVCS